MKSHICLFWERLVARNQGKFGSKIFVKVMSCHFCNRPSMLLLSYFTFVQSSLHAFKFALQYGIFHIHLLKDHLFSTYAIFSEKLNTSYSLIRTRTYEWSVKSWTIFLKKAPIIVVLLGVINTPLSCLIKFRLRPKILLANQFTWLLDRQCLLKKRYTRKEEIVVIISMAVVMLAYAQICTKYLDLSLVCLMLSVVLKVGFKITGNVSNTFLCYYSNSIKLLVLLSDYLLK